MLYPWKCAYFCQQIASCCVYWGNDKLNITNLERNVSPQPEMGTSLFSALFICPLLIRRQTRPLSACTHLQNWLESEIKMEVGGLLQVNPSVHGCSAAATEEWRVHKMKSSIFSMIISVLLTRTAPLTLASEPLAVTVCLQGKGSLWDEKHPRTPEILFRLSIHGETQSCRLGFPSFLSFALTNQPGTR